MVKRRALPFLLPAPRLAHLVTATWVAALYALSIGSLIFTREGEPTYQVDFDVYRHGAAAMASGVPLYDHDFLVSSSRIAMPFTYPPLAAELLVPITWLSYRPAALLWMGASILALVASLHVVARSLGLRPGLSAVLAVVAGSGAIWLQPIQSNLGLGQANIFLMLLVLADVLVGRTRWPRGMLVGLAAAVKLTPAAFVLVFLVRRDYRSAFIAATTAALLTGLGAAFAWPDSLAYWGGITTQSDRVKVFQGAANISLHGFLERTPLPGQWLMLAWAVSAAVTLGVAVIAMRRHIAAGEVAVAVMVNAIAIVLISPVSWDHHWVWVAPFLLLFTPATLLGSGTAMALMASAGVLFLVDRVGFEPLRGGWILWLTWGVSICALLARSTLHAAGASASLIRSAGAEHCLEGAGEDREVLDH